MSSSKKELHELYLEEVRAARKMSGEQKLALAVQLSDLACETTRQGIRNQFPEATPEEVEQILRKRFALARKLELQS